MTRLQIGFTVTDGVETLNFHYELPLEMGGYSAVPKVGETIVGPKIGQDNRTLMPRVEEVLHDPVAGICWVGTDVQEVFPDELLTLTGTIKNKSYWVLDQ